MEKDQYVVGDNVEGLMGTQQLIRQVGISARLLIRVEKDINGMVKEKKRNKTVGQTFVKFNLKVTLDKRFDREVNLVKLGTDDISED